MSARVAGLLGGLITLLGFAGLTAIAFYMGEDFSDHDMRLFIAHLIAQAPQRPVHRLARRPPAFALRDRLAHLA